MQIFHPVKIVIVITFLNKPHSLRGHSRPYDEQISSRNHASTNKEQNVKSDILLGGVAYHCWFIML